jgi:hypothetical protein
MRAGIIAIFLGVLTGTAAQNAVVTNVSANGAIGNGNALSSDGSTNVGFQVVRGGTGQNQNTFLIYSTTPQGCTGTALDGDGFIPNGDLVGDTGLKLQRLTLNVDTSTLSGFFNESCSGDFCGGGYTCTTFSGGPITIDWQDNQASFTNTSAGSVTFTMGNIIYSVTGNAGGSSTSVQGTLMGIPFQDPFAGIIGITHGMTILINRPH